MRTGELQVGLPGTKRRWPPRARCRRRAGAGRLPLVGIRALPRRITFGITTIHWRWSGLRETGRAMSRENVEIVRSMIDTWEQHGFDATIEAFDPDVEVVDLQSAIGMKDRGRGPEDLRRLADQWMQIFDDWRVEVLELADLGGEWVMAYVRFHGVGRDSGIPVSNPQFELYRLVGGRIAQMHVGFQDREQALAWVRRREGAAV